LEETAVPFFPEKGSSFFKPTTESSFITCKDRNVELRLFLQAPVPAGAWQGELNATEDGSECPQGFFSYFSGNEDCLFLNVYTPQVRETYKCIPIVQVFKIFLAFHGIRKVIKINCTL
jgi:hypothetical protein